MKHNYIGTEHLLLGLLREEEGLAARVLEQNGLQIEKVRAEVARIVGRAEEVTSGQIPFTPRSKKVLEDSLRQALNLGHNYIGTEHLLLSLVEEGDGIGVRILIDAGLAGEAIRNEVIRMLSGPGGHSRRQTSILLKSQTLLVKSQTLLGPSLSGKDAYDVWVSALRAGLPEEPKGEETPTAWPFLSPPEKAAWTEVGRRMRRS